MPIAFAQLLAFNNVESTDPIVGAVQLPFIKNAIYLPGVNFRNGFETYNGGTNGLGSQVLIRKLGKGSVKSAKATDASAFDYSHAYTADTLLTIPLDDVISKSEKVYEAVEKARASATGAKKAQVVIETVAEAIQAKITDYIYKSAQVNVAAGTEADYDATTIKDAIISARELLDFAPDTLIVPLEVETLLLKLITTGDFLQYHGKDTITTGEIGQLLGMRVFRDENLEYAKGTIAAPKDRCQFIMYNSEKFNVFPVLQDFDVIQAIDFKGSYVRALALMGNETNLSGFAATTKGNGAWAVKALRAAPAA